MAAVNLAGLLVFAAVLAAVGLWGHRNAASMARVPGMGAADVRRRERSMRRGAVTCWVAAALFVVMAVLPLFGRMS